MNICLMLYGWQKAKQHRQSTSSTKPDAEAIACDLEVINSELDQQPDAPKLAHLQDRVGVLADRVQWVESEMQREALEATLGKLWERLGVEK